MKKERNGRGKKNVLLIVLISVLAVLLAGGGTFVGYYLLKPGSGGSGHSGTWNNPVKGEATAQIYYSNLSGREVKTAAEVNQAVTAIMIENSLDARPQSGLGSASIIFEANAEGGITRFLTLFQDQKPQLIGPVRSIRLYYVDWLTPYQASVAHVGGSGDALALVRNGNYRDIDEFFNSGTYWRATDRYAPHNVYTSFNNIDALNNSRGYTTSDFTGFKRCDCSPVETPTATSINVTMSSYLYNSSYSYDAATNKYMRNMAEEPHMDREAGQIAPDVVVGMMVDEHTITSGGYGESIATVGSGTAYIFQNGEVISGTWQKASREAPLRFVDSGGNEIALNRGQVWIAAVPNGRGDVSWQ